MLCRLLVWGLVVCAGYWLWLHGAGHLRVRATGMGFGLFLVCGKAVRGGVRLVVWHAVGF